MDFFILHSTSSIFFLILSMVTVFIGSLLIVHGTSRKISFLDVILENFKNNKFDFRTKLGLVLNILGKFFACIILMYLTTSLALQLFWLIMICLFIGFTIKKLMNAIRRAVHEHIKILKKTSLSSYEIDEMWEIYQQTFEPLNKISPCKQSMDKEHFYNSMSDHSVFKYILYEEGVGCVGLGLITNKFSHTPWISEDYFKYNYSEAYKSNSIFYFMGIAINKSYRRKKLSLPLLEYIINDLPKDIIIGFDHSRNINPTLHFFTRVIRQAGQIRRTHIDKQLYHIIQYRH